MTRPSPVVGFVFALALPAACTDGSGGAAACRAFTTSLSVKDRMSQTVDVFNPNEPITFELLITNTRDTAATLTASSPCTAVVFEVTDSARRRWGSADDIACIQMLQPRTYGPRESSSESVTWNQADAEGAPVPPGSYRVAATVGQYVSDAEGMVDCREPLSRSAAFRIQ